MVQHLRKVQVQYLGLSKVLVFDVYDSTIQQNIRDYFTDLQLNAWQTAELEEAWGNMDDLTVTQKPVLEMVQWYENLSVV